ncbi:PepSY domain-containing protein [Flagellimonas sp. 389]|uniref:PepSY-associated TM helix domain-containing protein n=1 Tax=Flagellimonas sp. 389 TaxID=2835862 RepID=UPI001BD51964|nr:PepSY-associated TM helix domain-containing protein [Flagellimonas sp. 389]MBS9460910.1 PepSY domain-containing protein [Flagellimonas sp. 389]
MKLKALKPRLHNAMFHTHTVSGIVISFALFVCFYAGAVALFMDELYQWENPNARIEAINPAEVDYDKIVTTVAANIEGFDQSEQFGFVPPSKVNPLIEFYGSKTSSSNVTERFTASIHPTEYKILSYGTEPMTHMARTIYELHYFHQLPLIGIYLSGFVAFFFLFAVFTGVLTHWKNIVNKFYSFTIKGKWKQVWTNGHISLGIITLPFQIIYAVTGALLGLSLLLLAPSAFLMFDGDTNEVIKAVRPDAGIKYDKNAMVIDDGVSINSIYKNVSTSHPENPITYIYARNFGKEDGTVNVLFDDKKGITGDGIFVYGYKDGKLLQAIEPNNKAYSKGTYGVLIKLHYATFGGIFLKIIYFILAMITCYIILSGVMIWRTGRDNNKYTDKQRRFHHRVTKLYLAISLSMFPALALIFIANKLVPLEMIERVFYVNTIFFLGWLLLTLIGLFWNNYRKLNRNYIFLGSVFGLCIPVINGIITGDWIWKTLVNGQYYVFSVDATWLIIGVFGLLICQFYLNTKKDSEHILENSEDELVTIPDFDEKKTPVFQSISKDS